MFVFIRPCWDTFTFPIAALRVSRPVVQHLITIKRPVAERCCRYMMKHLFRQKPPLPIAQRATATAHLSRRLDSLPDTEVTDEPDDSQAQGQPPTDWTQFVQVCGELEHLPPRAQTEG